jgi:hypothetical protein
MSVWLLTAGWTTGVLFTVGAEIYSSTRRPYRFCGPPSLISSGYRPGGKVVEACSWPLASLTLIWFQG